MRKTLLLAVAGIATATLQAQDIQLSQDNIDEVLQAMTSRSTIVSSTR